MNLDELRAEAEKEEIENQEIETEEVAPELEADPVESELTEETEAADNSEEGEAEEVPTWLAEPKEDNRTVPLASHIKLRDKLKGNNRDLKAEIDALKAQLEQQTQANTVSAPVSNAMPTFESCDYDESVFQSKMAEYFNGQIEQRFNQQQQTQQQVNAERALKQRIDEHLNRAEQLVTKHNINPEVYAGADRNVRMAIDNIMPGQGDTITDTLIARLGDGSEKVLYALGRNQNELMRLQQELQNDPSGISASIYLGRKAAEYSNASATKKRSLAPKPAARANGDQSASVSVNDLQKRYAKALKSGKDQEALNIRRQARKAGHTTGDW